jgi:HlyD family secretion protein
MDSTVMKKLLVVAAVIVVAAGGYVMFGRGDGAETAPRPGGGGFPGGFGGNFRGGPRLPMTVELTSVGRADLSEQITVVGNLIGAATVAAAPKINGRLASVNVRMGDPVREGQTLAQVEDSEIREQVRQAEASFAVAEATVRQREADLRFAETNLDRSRNLFERQLIADQAMDDAESRQQAAAAQVDLARAQLAQSQARLEELRIALSNTTITSPVTGFVGSRILDPGAWVTPSSAFLSVVDISTVRLVANIVERDLRRIAAGQQAEVDVDAYPGEQFAGRVARVAPVLDPATRTAQIEVDIPNPDGRLKPGMYARVRFTVEERENALVVPANAVVTIDGRLGVFMPGEGETAEFRPITTGLQDQTFMEVSAGLQEGDSIVTTGAAALRAGDRISIAAPVSDEPAAAAEGRGGFEGRGRRGDGSAAPGRFGGRGPARGRGDS